MMNQPPQMMMNTVQVQVPVQPQMMNQSHQLMASAAHSQAMNQLAASQSQPINSGPQMMTQPPPLMIKDSWKFENKPLSMGSISAISSVPAASGSNTQGNKPPTLNELQNQ
ncbi:hypothetical protein Gotur_034241, partial [Gossypium turneri]